MKTLAVGIGCRSHSSAAGIEAAVQRALDALGPFTFAQIHAIASIDSKAGEPGLLEFCARHALPLKLFSRAQIAAVAVRNPSAAARAHLGVDGVCEPCALLAAHTASNTARLFAGKTVHGGVTVAIASSSSHGVAADSTHLDIRPTQQDLP